LFQHNKQKIQEEYLDELQHHLETLSQKTKGLFIQIPDLPEDWASRASQLETIQDRIRAIETELQDSNTTDLDKQQLVDELLSLRTYIEELSNQSRDAVHQQQCKQLKEEVGRITLSSEELQSMLRNAGVNWTAKTRSNGIQLSLWQTLRLVFRHFFRR
jgi:chromosome segregation ATPase